MARYTFRIFGSVGFPGNNIVFHTQCLLPSRRRGPDTGRTLKQTSRTSPQRKYSAYSLSSCIRNDITYRGTQDVARCVCGMELFSYVDRFTVTDLLTGFPSGAVQEIVNVVVFVSATVEALPEGAAWEKAPSGGVIVRPSPPVRSRIPTHASPRARSRHRPNINFRRKDGSRRGGARCGNLLHYFDARRGGARSH